jgi:hypothetical protein
VAARNSPTRIAISVIGVLVVALAGSLIWSRVMPTDQDRVSDSKHRVIRVQVLNGSGEGGVASRVASFLREGGFQVVEVRNADRSDYFTTMVVSRRPGLAAARAVAHDLGDLPVIRQAWESDLAEVTVVLGSDRSRLRLE